MSAWVRVGGERIIARADSANHYRFPDIVEAADGTWLLCCRWGLHHTGNDGKVVIQRSSNQGATWSTPTIIRDHSSLDDRGYTLIVAPNGDILAFNDQFDASAYQHLQLEYGRSTDNGITFPDSSWQNFPDEPDLGWKALYPEAGYFIVDGTIYTWLEFSDTGKHDGNWVVEIWSSDDNGASWNKYSTIHDYTVIKGCETAVFRASDIHWIAIMRDCDYNTTYRFDSYDSGQTWSSPQDIGPTGSGNVLILHRPMAYQLDTAIALFARNYVPSENQTDRGIVYRYDAVLNEFRDPYHISTPAISDGYYFSLIPKAFNHTHHYLVAYKDVETAGDEDIVAWSVQERNQLITNDGAILLQSGKPVHP